jgi:hypothetical protein
MKTNFEKSLRKVRIQLKKTIDEKEKTLLREELNNLKESIKKEQKSS